MDARAAADLEELARRDEELSAGTTSVRELDARVAAIRARCEAIDAFFAAYPEEEERRRREVAEADAERARRAAELAGAEQELAAAPDAETRERAEIAAARARDHVAVAEAGVERTRDAAAELERDASELSREVPRLESQARAVSAEVDDVPPAPTGLRELLEWASHAHAELFVAAGQLDAQRDRVIREANELATMLLGEQTFGSTVAQLAERVLPLARE